MPIEIRPDRTALVRLADDPQFSAELEALGRQMPVRPAVLVIDLSGVKYLNSSNLARLLRLRKQLIEDDGRLALCGLNAQVKGVFRATALDKVFVITPHLDEAIQLVNRPPNL